jgi:hypothetical protein
MTDKHKTLQAWEKNRGRGTSGLYWQRCDDVGHIVVRIPVEMEDLRGALDGVLPSFQFEVNDPVPNVWSGRWTQAPIESGQDNHRCGLCGKRREEVRKFFVENDQCVIGVCDECVRFIYENLLEPGDKTHPRETNAQEEGLPKEKEAPATEPPPQPFPPCSCCLRLSYCKHKPPEHCIAYLCALDPVAFDPLSVPCSQHLCGAKKGESCTELVPMDSEVGCVLTSKTRETPHASRIQKAKEKRRGDIEETIHRMGALSPHTTIHGVFDPHTAEPYKKSRTPEKTEKRPFACPICEGTGHFGYEPTTVPMPSLCRSCDGTGIVWGPPR